MTWKSHGIFNGIVLWSTTHDLQWTAGGFLCSHLPDWLEFWVLPHRGPTHILSLWMAAAAVAFVSGYRYAEIIAVAGILHLVADAFSETGIPMWPWNPISYDWKSKANRLRYPCYRTGQISEQFFILGVLGVATLYYFATHLSQSRP